MPFETVDRTAEIFGLRTGHGTNACGSVVIIFVTDCVYLSGVNFWWHFAAFQKEKKKKKRKKKEKKKEEEEKTSSTRVNKQGSSLVLERRHTQTQQQRPESPTISLSWHASKYKVHKLHHILELYKTSSDWWSEPCVHSHARWVTVGDWGLCCCVCVKSFRALINSFICRFCIGTLGLVLFQIVCPQEKGWSTGGLTQSVFYLIIIGYFS